MTEYCPHLWKTVTIDHKGDVFHCCKIKPLSLGSIYEKHLSELLNIPEIQSVREESLHGTLPCYADCNLIRKPCDAASDITKACDYNRLTDLYVDFGMKCNICCVMCKQREKYKTDKRDLTCAILKKNIDYSPFQHIYLQGGEPLYIEECLKFMDYLSSIGKKYSLLTNGLLIPDSMAKKLTRNAALISISLNAATKNTHEIVNKGSSWENVLENIANIRRYRQEYGTSLSINGRMTLTHHSLGEIPLFLKSFEEFGFDTANFGYDSATVPKYLEEHPGFKKNLSAQIKVVLADAEMKKIDTLRLEQLGLI